MSKGFRVTLALGVTLIPICGFTYRYFENCDYYETCFWKEYEGKNKEAKSGPLLLVSENAYQGGNLYEVNALSIHMIGTQKLEEAKQFAREASSVVQDPPHPVETWEKAIGLWNVAISSLESIDENASVFSTTTEKLAQYRAARDTIVKRKEIEVDSSNAYKSGREIIDEVIDLTKGKSSYTVAELNNVKAKVYSAVQMFASIPTGTMISASASKRLDSHRKDLEKITKEISDLQNCSTSFCGSYISVRVAVFTDATASYGDTPVREPARGSCSCPYDIDSSGKRCGDRSAYSRPGGSSPVCYK